MKIGIYLLWLSFSTLINTLIFNLLWHWFLVPDPIGFPALGLVHVFGISLAITYVVNLNSGTTATVAGWKPDEILTHSMKHGFSLWTVTAVLASVARLGL